MAEEAPEGSWLKVRQAEAVIVEDVFAEWAGEFHGGPLPAGPVLDVWNRVREFLGLEALPPAEPVEYRPGPLDSAGPPHAAPAGQVWRWSDDGWALYVAGSAKRA